MNFITNLFRFGLLAIVIIGLGSSIQMAHGSGVVGSGTAVCNSPRGIIKSCVDWL
ncbi:MAG: hypothetical protein GY805_30030 [Chloroflexi bacterium]|nr:hypothetical protein [Chloroflexota bacterium]